MNPGGALRRIEFLQSQQDACARAAIEQDMAGRITDWDRDWYHTRYATVSADLRDTTALLDDMAAAS